MADPVLLNTSNLKPMFKVAEEEDSNTNNNINTINTTSNSNLNTSTLKPMFKIAEEEEVDEEEESNLESLTKAFEDESFVAAFKNSLKQYVSEKILTDDYNSFSIIPPIDTDYKDETYTISISFSSAVSITVDDKGSIVDREISDIGDIKYKTPTMDVMELLEDEGTKGLIDLYIMESLDDIKKVAR